MAVRFVRMGRSLGLAAVSAVLALALVSPPAAVADDRLQFTGTTLSGDAVLRVESGGQAGGAVVLDAVVPVLQRRSAQRQPGRRRKPRRDLRRCRGPFQRGGHAVLRVEIQPELHEPQRRGRLHLGAVQRAVAAGLRLLPSRRLVDVREQPDVGDAPTGAVRPGGCARVDRRRAWIKTWSVWRSPPV